MGKKVPHQSGDQPKQQTAVKPDQWVQVQSLLIATCGLLGQSLIHIMPQLPCLELAVVMKANRIAHAETNTDTQ